MPAAQLVYFNDQELPNTVFDWSAAGEDFSTGWTFTIKLARTTAAATLLFTKTAGITSTATAVTVAWSVTDWAGLEADVGRGTDYFVYLYARRTADSKDIEFNPGNPTRLTLKAAPGTSAVSPSSYPVTVTAATVSVADTGGYYTATNVEDALEELKHLSAERYTVKVLIVGSSGAAGYNASDYSLSWAGKLTTALASTHTFVNEAIPGTSPTYWINPDATSGMSVLEGLLIEHRPHVVIVQFTGQNMGGPSATLFKVSSMAAELIKSYNARPILITPYISNSYTTAQQDDNAWAANQIIERDYPCLNFASVWGPGPTIPAAVDSDGTHLNDTGHLELFRQIPQDYLQITHDLKPLRMPSIQAGLTIPASSAAPPVGIASWPAGSFTVGFVVKIPSSPATGIALLAWTSGSTTTHRIRIPSTGGAGLVNLDFAQGSTITTAATITDNTEHHIAMTYNAVSRLVKLYVDGVFFQSGTGEVNTFNTLAGIGQRPDLTSLAVAYRFRNFTVHSTDLDARQVARLASGIVPMANMWTAATMQDASARPAGAKIQTLFGTVIPTTGIALA